MVAGAAVMLCRMTDAPENEASGGTLPDVVRDGVWVVIAAYNEERSVAGVVSELRKTYPNVIVVDDGSADGTKREASRVARYTLRHAVNRGQGAALQTGLEFVLSKGARYIVTFDADGQHDPADIAAMVRPIAEGDVSITLGSRFLGEAGRSNEIPRLRRLTLRLAVLFTRVVNRVRLSDAHNGLRCFSAEAAGRIRITADRMAHASEIIDLIRDTKLPYREVPVRVRYTAYSMAKGQSSLAGFRIVLHYMVGRIFD